MSGVLVSGERCWNWWCEYYCETWSEVEYIRDTVAFTSAGIVFAVVSRDVFLLKNKDLILK